jgi:hypothetical protein
LGYNIASRQNEIAIAQPSASTLRLQRFLQM